jgi:hypothetical protein
VNYPENIYSKYEIIEKDICGEKHYGLVKICKFLFWEYGKQIKVYSSTSGFGRIDPWAGGSKWHNSKLTIVSAIEWEREMQEYYFAKKMTK